MHGLFQCSFILIVKCVFFDTQLIEQKYIISTHLMEFQVIRSVERNSVADGNVARVIHGSAYLFQAFHSNSGG